MGSSITDTVSLEQYLQTVKVIILPIPETAEVLENGGYGAGTLFWLHTAGMAKYDRPEMEIIDVPGDYIPDACNRLNRWAYASIANEILPLQSLREGDSPYYPEYEVVLSPEDVWEDEETVCLRIRFKEVSNSHIPHRPTIH